MSKYEIKLSERLTESLNMLPFVSQRELAQKCGVNESLISRFLSGARLPRIDTLVKMAKALNVSTDYLLGISDSPKSTEFTDSVSKNYIRELEEALKEQTGFNPQILIDLQSKAVSKALNKDIGEVF